MGQEHTSWACFSASLAFSCSIAEYSSPRLFTQGSVFVRNAQFDASELAKMMHRLGEKHTLTNRRSHSGSIIACGGAFLRPIENGAHSHQTIRSTAILLVDLVVLRVFQEGLDRRMGGRCAPSLPRWRRRSPLGG
jgi:hypothetical protein